MDEGRELDLETDRHTTRAIKWGSEDGPPVVMLHSLGLDADEFGFLIPDLTGQWNAMAIDMWGHGQARQADDAKDISLPRLARDIIHSIMALGLHPVHLVGHSLGAAIAAQVTASSPSLVRSLALVSCPLAGSPTFERRAIVDEMQWSEVVQQTLERWFSARTLATGGAAVSYATTCLNKMPPSAWSALWRAFGRWEGVPSSLGRLVPTTVICGADDISTPPSMAVVIAERTGAISTHVVPDAGHMLPLEHPRETAQILEALWRSS